jgi:hypothetical protein
MTPEAQQEILNFIKQSKMGKTVDLADQLNKKKNFLNFLKTFEDFFGDLFY